MKQPLRIVTDSAVPVTNKQFLQAIFGEEWTKAHVTAFEDDPQDIAEDRRGACWGGGEAGSRLKRFSRAQNQYFCISLFELNEDGERRRRKGQFDACFVVVADDVKEKLPEERVALLPPPSYKMNSSEGSEQWGWILEPACESRAQVENLLDGLVTQGLAPDGTDPGMKGVTRYVRLPEGCNTKASRLINGKPFRCFISEWNPERTVSVDALAAVFGIDLHRERAEAAGVALAADDPLVARHPIFKYLHVTEVGNEGWLRVDCPNAEHHSSDDPSGAAVQIQADGRVHFVCHHGHCQGEKDTDGKKLTGPGIIRLLDKKLFGGSGELLDEVDDYIKQIYAHNVTSLAKVVDPQVPSEDGEAHAPGEEESAQAKPRFDPLRYIFMAPENRFYDIRSGLLVSPRGLDNLYLQELPPGRNKLTASELLLRTMDPDMSTADGIGWHPTGPTPPMRQEIVFEDEGRKLINTWAGFALTPVEGDVSLWLDHVDYLIPDEGERKVTLDYLACLVQRLDEKPAFFLAHRGAHRVGKDLMYKALVKAMGARCAKTLEMDEMLGGWGDYLSEVKFAIITEVDKAQDRKVANALKTITAPTASGKRILNMKGKGVHTQVDCMGGVMMSNKRAFMSIEPGDRRYFVLDSWVQPRDPEYYKAIDTWYKEQDGCAKVLNYLLNRDISNFNHMQLPYMTKGALEMVQSGKYDYEQDLEELEHQGQPPFHMDVVTAKDLRALVRAEGLKCGNNGLDEAMRGLGFKKFARYRVKQDGRSVAVPTFYTKNLSDDASPREVFDFYQQGAGVTKND